MFYPLSTMMPNPPLYKGVLPFGFKTQADHKRAWRVNNVPAFVVYIPLLHVTLARKKILETQVFSCALGVLWGCVSNLVWCPRDGPNRHGIWINYYICITHNLECITHHHGNAGTLLRIHRPHYNT